MFLFRLNSYLIIIRLILSGKIFFLFLLRLFISLIRLRVIGLLEIILLLTLLRMIIILLVMFLIFVKSKYYIYTINDSLFIVYPIRLVDNPPFLRMLNVTKNFYYYF